jgi:hypothetical protein
MNFKPSLCLKKYIMTTIPSTMPVKNMQKKKTNHYEFVEDQIIQFTD